MAADLDADQEGGLLFALAGGLVQPALIGHYSPEALVGAVD